MLVARNLKETRTPTTGAQAPSLGRMSRLASLVQSRSESVDAPHDGQRQARRPQAADGPGARFARVRAVWLLNLKLGVCGGFARARTGGHWHWQFILLRFIKLSSLATRRTWPMAGQLDGRGGACHGRQAYSLD